MNGASEVTSAETSSEVSGTHSVRDPSTDRTGRNALGYTNVDTAVVAGD